MKPHPRHCPLCGGAGWRMVRSNRDNDKRNQPPMFIRVACGWYDKDKAS